MFRTLCLVRSLNFVFISHCWRNVVMEVMNAGKLKDGKEISVRSEIFTNGLTHVGQPGESSSFIIQWESSRVHWIITQRCEIGRNSVSVNPTSVPMQKKFYVNWKCLFGKVRCHGDPLLIDIFVCVIIIQYVNLRNINLRNVNPRNIFNIFLSKQ